jgi:hypothetical protein
MAYYRIYMLDRAGRILTGSDVVCDSDKSAFAWAATTLGNDARVEVWEGSRCLGRLSAASVPLTAQADFFRECGWA